VTRQFLFYQTAIHRFSIRYKQFLKNTFNLGQPPTGEFMRQYIVELNFVVERLKDLVREYHESGLRTPSHVNSATWLAGHAAFSLHDMIVRPLCGECSFPADFNALFCTGSQRQDESEYPGFEDVLKVLDQQSHEARRLIGSTDLNAVRLPDDLVKEGFFSAENLITHTIQDIAYHNGQLSYLIKLIDCQRDCKPGVT
jgi:hypothetical protein